MKTALVVTVLALACLLAADCSAQSMNNRLSLSGDSGKSILASLKANDTQSNETAANNTSLWSWGSAPKGSLLVDGKLLTDPFNTWRGFDAAESGIAQVGVDPYRGYPVYAHQDPVTGVTQYYYIDPYTGTPFYLDGYGGVDSSGIVTTATGGYMLPQVFG